jgi:hypothetical protein
MGCGKSFFLVPHIRENNRRKEQLLIEKLVDKRNSD